MRCGTSHAGLRFLYMPEHVSDPSSPPVLLQNRDGRLLTLTLNAPASHNRLTLSMCRELAEALREADRDASVGAVLLKGAGAAFCIGTDAQELLLEGAVEAASIHEELFTIGGSLTTPLVCQVQGAAHGAGVALLANAHVTLAAQGTTFGLTEIRMGDWPFVAFRSLAEAVGERRATELALSGRIFGTNEALQYSLIHAVTPPFELEERAEATARLLAESSGELIRRGLDFVGRTRAMPWGDAGALARQVRSEWLRHPDFAEGVAALAERRKPDWPSLRESAQERER